MHTGIRQPAERDVADSKGEAGGAIDEDGIVDEVPGPPAQRSEPWVRELVIGELSAGTREVEIRLDTIHECTVLPVVAALYAAVDPARIDAADIRGPLETSIGADIRTQPEAGQQRC